MSKSNIFIYAILFIGLIGMFIIWIVMDYYKDHWPYLFVSIAWLALIIIAVVAIVVVEKKRRQKLQTIFLGEDSLYNPEMGIVEYGPHGSVLKTMTAVLNHINYDDDIVPMPHIKYIYVVNTESYSKNDSGAADWKGSVRLASEPKGSSKRFGSKTELVKILSKPI